jgi:hypothetical protein
MEEIIEFEGEITDIYPISNLTLPKVTIAGKDVPASKIINVLFYEHKGQMKSKKHKVIVKVEILNE